LIEPSSEQAVRPLARLFAPHSIAVVGASTTPGKAGNVLMGSLAAFSGPVYAVNPRGEEVAGRTGFARVRDLPGGVDLALVAVPAEVVGGVLRECAEAEVGAAVVHSGGWAEAGAGGEQLQASLVSLARSTGLRILGPNTSGFFDPAAGLCASFVRPAADLPPGGLAIVAQSGGVNHALAFLAAGEGLGIRIGVGLGNAADVDFADVLGHLVGDETVEVVALAIEGVDDGRRLVEAVEQLVETVPVVALKTGRTDVDAFSRSHTGALTGSWRVTRSALAQAGAVVVDDLTQLVDAAVALGLVRLPAGASPGVGVVTGQAGPGLLLAGELGVRSVRVPELPAASVERLGDLLPPITYQRNPVDTGRPAESFGAVLQTVGGADGIDLVAVYLLDEPDAVDPAGLLGASSSPSVLALTAVPERLAAVRNELASRRVPVLPTPERCARAVAALVRDAGQRARRAGRAGGPALPVPSFAPAGPWDEDSAKTLVAELGLATPARAVCATHAEAHAAFAQLVVPVVVKVLRPGLDHKSDVGGVHLGVADGAALNRALAAIDHIDGARYLIEETAPTGPELILGARRDPAFGPVVALGTGGTGAESVDDAAVRLAPVGAADAAAMLGELAGASAFRGARGAAAVDEQALADAIVAFGELIAARDDIAELEVNPLRVTRDGLLALDALVVAR
jgi:acetate---CoA ligase (ADP-forming)